jgi:DNA-binding CsgD family transcriptional regulator
MTEPCIRRSWNPMRLSHKDYDLLLEAIRELHDYRDIESFRQAIPGIFLKLIPADDFILTNFEFGAGPAQVKMIDCVESETRMDPETARSSEEIVGDLPFTKYFMAGGKMSALRVSDFYTLREYYNSVLWSVTNRQLRGKYVILVPVAAPKGNAAASLTRWQRDFTERDRLVLNLARGHFNQARRNAELASALLAKGARPLSAYDLTPRETDIVHWLAAGKTNPEIAVILNSKARTIDKHMERILKKFQAENRVTVALAAIQAIQCGKVEAILGEKRFPA